MRRLGAWLRSTEYRGHQVVGSIKLSIWEEQVTLGENRLDTISGALGGMEGYKS